MIKIFYLTYQANHLARKIISKKILSTLKTVLDVSKSTLLTLKDNFIHFDDFQ